MFRKFCTQRRKNLNHKILNRTNDAQEIPYTKEEESPSQNIRQNKFLKKNKPKSTRKESTMSNPVT